MKFWKRVFEPFYLSYLSCERTSGFSRTAAPIFLAPHRGATDLGRHFSRFSRWQFPSPCKSAKMASPKCLVLIIELVMAYLELELPKVRQLKWTTLSSWFTTKQWLIWVFHNSTWISHPLSPVKSINTHPNFQKPPRTHIARYFINWLVTFLFPATIVSPSAISAIEERQRCSNSSRLAGFAEGCAPGISSYGEADVSVMDWMLVRFGYVFWKNIEHM